MHKFLQGGKYEEKEIFNICRNNLANIKYCQLKNVGMKKEICMTNFDVPGVTKCDKCSQRLNFVPIIHDNIVDIMSIYKKDEYMEEIEN